LEVADIFRDHGPAWRRANAGHVSLEQLKGRLKWTQYTRFGIEEDAMPEAPDPAPRY
jgi:hypothetical protein